MLQIIDTFPVFQKLFFNLIMFIFISDTSNSGKDGRGAAHKLYGRAFEPVWVLFSIFRSDLFSAQTYFPLLGEEKFPLGVEYIFESKFPLVARIGLAARACGSGIGQSPSNSE